MKNKRNFTQKFIIIMLTLAIFSVIPQYHYCNEEDLLSTTDIHSIKFLPQNDF